MTFSDQEEMREFAKKLMKNVDEDIANERHSIMLLLTTLVLCLLALSVTVVAVTI